MTSMRDDDTTPRRRAEDELLEELDVPDVRTALLGALGETRRAVDLLAAGIERLASKDDLETVRVGADKSKRKLWIAVAAVAAFVVALAAGLEDLHAIAESNERTGEIILECTTPTVDPTDPHECYERSEERARQTEDRVLEGFDRRLEHYLEQTGSDFEPYDPDREENTP
jgi:hypothetical protein